MAVYPAAVEAWRPLVTSIFNQVSGGRATAADIDKALYVIQWESSGNPNAQSDSGGYGLFQLNDGGLGEGLSTAQRLDPQTNIRVAAQAIYGGSGWAPWGEGSEKYNYPYNPATGQGRFGSLGDRPYPGGTGVASTPTIGGVPVQGPPNPNVAGGFQDSSGFDGAAVQAVMNAFGVTRDQALQYLGFSGAGSGADHFFDISPTDQRDFDESVYRDRRDFDYNAGQDAIQNGLQQAQLDLQKAIAAGDAAAAQRAQNDKNYWSQVAAQQNQDGLNLQNQGQQLDYNLGLQNVAANRYGTDADLALGNAKIAADVGLGQQANQTNQYDVETRRLDSERNYLLGMANATTDAERAAIEDRKRQDDVAIANMQAYNNFILGQQGNQVDAFSANTDRMRSNQQYNVGLAQAYNDLLGLGIQDASRLDANSQFNTSETNKFNLGQQANQTSQFGAETDRANRMGQLALQNNQFILDAANSPRDMYGLYFMQRGLAPDWDTIMAGGTPAQGSALAPVDVMGAYKPVTEAPSFNLTAAQSTAQPSQNGGGYNLSSNPFLQNWQQANTATDTLPQFNATAHQATAQAGSGYDASKNPYIGAQPSFQPTTQAPSFNMQAPQAQAPQWNGPSAITDFIAPKTSQVSGPPKQFADVNPYGQQGGVPVAALQQGLNLSTVGGPDIKGSDFTMPAFYDQGMTQRVGAGDTVKGGSQVYVWYGDNMPGAGGQIQKPYDPNQIPYTQGNETREYINGQWVPTSHTPLMASGGVTQAPQYVTGDDPGSPDGLGENAELNTPVVASDGTYMGTHVLPLNPARRPMGNTWNNDALRMAAGFGIHPRTLFSKAA